MKKSGYVFLSGLLLALGLFLAACAPAATEAPLPSAAAPEGATMLWVDGSTLVAIAAPAQASGGGRAALASFAAPENQDPIPHLRWFYKTKVTNYMYWTCMQTGECMVPPGDPDFEAKVMNPMMANMPVMIDDPNTMEDYCMWAGGRLPTAQETEKFNGFVPAVQSEMGFRCVVDMPHAMTPMCETSAFYDPMASQPPEPDHPFTQTGQFCQGGQGYVTGKLEDPDGTFVPAVQLDVKSLGEGTCQVFEDDKVVCYGAPGSEAEALLFDTDMLPADVNLMCQAGFDMNAEMPAQCDYMMGGIQNGCPSDSSAMQLEGGGYFCMMKQTGQGRTAAPALVAFQGAIKPCPPGMYFDMDLNACVSPGPLSEGCLGGYEMDSAQGCCMAMKPEMAYPGCPMGQAYEPNPAMCDSDNMYVPDGVLHTVKVSLQLPECGAGGPGGGPCPAGQALICPPLGGPCRCQ